MVRALCSCCGLKMKVPDNFTASLGRCPHCGEVVVNPLGELSKKNLEYYRKNQFFLRRFLEIRYDELTLFLLSAALLLIALVNISVMVGWLRGFSFLQLLGFSVAFSGIGFWLGGGFILSLYHVFTKRLKKPGEKAVMLYFVVITNVFSGFAVAHYMHVEAVWVEKWYLGILSLWTFLNSFLLLVKYCCYDSFHEDSIIADENASLGQVLLAFVVLLIVFGLCHFVFNLNWAITFSISVVYATSFSKAFRELIPNRAHVQTSEKIGDQQTDKCS